MCLQINLITAKTSMQKCLRCGAGYQVMFCFLIGPFLSNHSSECCVIPGASDCALTSTRCRLGS